MLEAWVGHSGEINDAGKQQLSAPSNVRGLMYSERTSVNSSAEYLKIHNESEESTHRIMYNHKCERIEIANTNTTEGENKCIQVMKEREAV